MLIPDVQTFLSIHKGSIDSHKNTWFLRLCLNCIIYNHAHQLIQNNLSQKQKLNTFIARQKSSVSPDLVRVTTLEGQVKTFEISNEELTKKMSDLEESIQASLTEFNNNPEKYTENMLEKASDQAETIQVATEIINLQSKIYSTELNTIRTEVQNLQGIIVKEQDSHFAKIAQLEQLVRDQQATYQEAMRTLVTEMVPISPSSEQALCSSPSATRR